MRRSVVLVFSVLGAGIALTCARAGDPVRESVDAIVRAAAARDAGRLFEQVTTGFQASDGSGLADARAMTERYFAAYEELKVTVRDVQIERAENAARVRLRAEMSGRPRRIGGLDGLLPSTGAYDFDLRFTREGGRWKVAWAQWTPAA